jgi:hypothetical protein
MKTYNELYSVKFKMLYSGRHAILVNGEQVGTIYNPSKEDSDYPNCWIISTSNAESFHDLKGAKKYVLEHGSELTF